MKLRCTIMRGGTSKGILLRRDDLPRDPALRDRVILRVFGSPDRRQIDGLGGADPLTSKLAIIGAPTRADADIDYTFGQVEIETAKVDYGGYCGNILSAVAAYAVNEGFVAATAPAARVRVHMTNAGRLAIAEVPVENGMAAERGALAIAGVPGTGAPIRLDFADTAGSATGKLLPTGHASEEVSVDGIGRVEISVVDIANPMVFAPAAAFGVKPGEGPDELDGRRDLIDAVERLRVALARRCAILGPGGAVSDNIPLVALVAPPADYVGYVSRAPIAAGAMDFTAREFFQGRLHKAFGVAETICTAAAALIRGTVVQRLAGEAPRQRGNVRIGHPSGVIEVEAEAAGPAEQPSLRRIVVERTARRIFEGVVHLPDDIMAATS